MRSCPDPLTIKEWPPRDQKKGPSLFAVPQMVPRVTVQTFGKRPNDVPCWDRRSDDVVLLAPYSVPPDGCIGAVFFAVRKRVVFFLGIFFLPYQSPH